MFMESRFQKWYADGNRKPANIGVQIADLEGTLDGISSWSSERLEKFQSLVYFMITFGGGYPNAVLVNS